MMGDTPEMDQSETLARSANLLNVFAVLLGDALTAPEIVAAARSASETAALITIASYPGQTIKTLARILDLSHSAAVRLIDKLVEDGLVRVVRGSDRRSVEASITPAGQAVTAAILEQRRARLEAMLAALEPAETDQLTRLMTKMIAAETNSPQAGDRLCRFCDLANCPQEICPVEQEACRLRARASPP
jgi:DNA-binding MarR family transcriptional regulator